MMTADSDPIRIPGALMRLATTASRCLTLASMLWLWCARALALDPALDISQYAHTAWKHRDGFAKGVAFEFAQTADGYLWLGTTNGLTRFDGVRNVPWQPPAGTSLPDNRVRALLVARDGTLWIGTWAGLASWNGREFVTYPGLKDRVVNALAEDREGAIWVAGVALPQTGFLCAVRAAKTDCTAEPPAAFGRVGSLRQAHDGNLWVGAVNGFWRQQPGVPKEYSLPEPLTGSLHMFAETADGIVLVLTRNAVLRVVNDKAEPFPIPDLPRGVSLSQILVDRDGGIWIGTLDGGLLHFHQGRVDQFRRSDGLSSDRVFDLFEDREGNVWVSTFDGIDRFRALPATTYSAAQGLAGSQGTSVLADRDGSIWIMNTEGLYRWRDGRIFAYRAQRKEIPSSQPTIANQVLVPGLPEHTLASLFQDRMGRIWLGSQKGLGYLEQDRFAVVSGVPNGYIDSIAEDRDGNLWIAHRDAGLLRLSPDMKLQNVPLPVAGKPRNPYRLAVDPVHGGLWLGFLSGGVVHFVDGRIDASYTAADGLGKGIVNDLGVAPEGTLWASTDGGLTRIKGGRFATLTSKSGLPCDAVHSAIMDGDGAMWVYSSCGMVRIARSDLDAWTTAVDLDKPPPAVRMAVLDDSDGVPGFLTPGSTATPHLTKARDGKLWFLSVDGVTVVDPRHLPFNTLPPPLHVEQIVADRKAYEAASSQPQLPPLVRDLQIDYTALSFVAPEKNLFRYKLEGRDRDWQDAGNRRQTFYTDLDPGTYRFRVIAANNSGVWNEEGASLGFSVAPAYWQTNSFRAVCVAAFLLVLWALYRLRLRQIAQGFNARLEERVGERTRIARDLHDTLLQSFQGLLLRFQVVYEMLPPTAAKEVLGGAIDQTAQAINEGRDAVQGLRASTVETNNLAASIRRLGEELAIEGGHQRAAGIRVEVEGVPRNLQPIVRDEVYRIAGEALRNAFRHAEAKQIEVELRYDGQQFRLRIRDDGKGIDAEFRTPEGRAGHFGLHGMCERAKLMGGKLTVWTAQGAGTEIELSVPAAHAYAASPAPGGSWIAEKFSGKSTKVE